MGAPAQSPHSLCSHSVILSWSRAMIEGSRRELKWDLLAYVPEVKRGGKSEEAVGVTERSGNRERAARQRDDLEVMESLACFHTRARQRGINPFYLFWIFFLYLGVFLAIITPCHPPGDSSETLGGTAPPRFTEYLPPARYRSHRTTTHTHTQRTQKNERAGK